MPMRPQPTSRCLTSMNNMDHNQLNRKLCKKCGVGKLMCEFYYSNTNGVSNTCKQCVKEAAAAKRAALMKRING